MGTNRLTVTGGNAYLTLNASTIRATIQGSFLGLLLVSSTGYDLRDLCPGQFVFGISGATISVYGDNFATATALPQGPSPGRFGGPITIGKSVPCSFNLNGEGTGGMRLQSPDIVIPYEQSESKDRDDAVKKKL